MVRSGNPTIALIQNRTSLASVRALRSLAICEVCDFFNVSKNMNDTQIAMTADLIIEHYWHLRIEEIKYCFRNAMRTEKLYDRLDGNIILGWLQVYDNERTEEAMRISDQEATQQIEADPEAVSYEEYVSSLRQRAESDKQAKEILEYIDKQQSSIMKLPTAEEKHLADLEFFKHKYQHNKNEKREEYGH